MDNHLWEPPKLDLAEDWLCRNTKCSIRWTDQCPVYRLIHNLTAPRINNVIHFPWTIREKSGFQLPKDAVVMLGSPDVIKLAEERQWRELIQILEIHEAWDTWRTWWEISVWIR